MRVLGYTRRTPALIFARNDRLLEFYCFVRADNSQRRFSASRSFTGVIAELSLRGKYDNSKARISSRNITARKHACISRSWPHNFRPDRQEKIDEDLVIFHKIKLVWAIMRNREKSCRTFTYLLAIGSDLSLTLPLLGRPQIRARSFSMYQPFTVMLTNLIE